MKLLTNLKPLLFTLSIFIIGFNFFISIAQAADFSITCNPNGCTSPANAIVDEPSIAPGDSITRTFQVKNNHHETLNLDMTTTKDNSTDDIFLDAVDVIVLGLGGRTRFDDTLRQFLNNPNIDLGSLNASGQKQVKITFAFQPVGNQYQNKQAIFDIPVHIDIQGRGGFGTRSTSTTTTSVSSITNPIPFTFKLKPIILGSSTPSSKLQKQIPSPSIRQLKKLYQQWWFWLLLLGPLFWWFLRLYKRWRSR